jgi:hypothetical protein
MRTATLLFWLSACGPSSPSVTVPPPSSGSGDPVSMPPLPQPAPEPIPPSACVLKATGPAHQLCFVYRDWPPDVARALCERFGGSLGIGAACPAEGHVGTCVSEAGLERWSYAPDTADEARAACDKINGPMYAVPGTFFAAGVEVKRHASVPLACIDEMTAQCRIDFYGTPEGKEMLSRRCLGMGTEAMVCPEQKRVSGRCYTSSLQEVFFYGPKHDSVSAKEACEDVLLGAFGP